MATNTDPPTSAPSRSLGPMFPLADLSDREVESLDRVRTKLLAAPFFDHVPLPGFPLTLPVALDLAIKAIEWMALNGDEATYWAARYVLPALRAAHQRGHG